MLVVGPVVFSFCNAPDFASAARIKMCRALLEVIIRLNAEDATNKYMRNDMRIRPEPISVCMLTKLCDTQSRRDFSPRCLFDRVSLRKDP